MMNETTMGPFWYRQCAVCEQGRLFVKTKAAEGPLYLLCEECFCAFDTPEEASDGNNCREGIDLGGNFASQDLIEVFGWAKYDFNEAS
jgi:hypothetical protein